MELHEKIKKLRLDKGLKQIDVAKAAGIKQSSYSLIEFGKTKNISLDVAKGISIALDIPFDELFEIDKPIKWKEDINYEINELKQQLTEKQKVVETFKSWYLVGFIRSYSYHIYVIETLIKFDNDEKNKNEFADQLIAVMEKEFSILKRDI